MTIHILGIYHKECNNSSSESRVSMKFSSVLKQKINWYFEHIRQEESVYLDSEVDEHIHWFQREFMKTDKDWREIDRRMSQTLEIRRKMIDCRAPLKDILTMFPFLKCPYQVSYSHKTASGLGVTFASRSFSSSFLWSGDQTAWQGSGCGSQYGVSRTVKAVRASGSPFEREPAPKSLAFPVGHSMGWGEGQVSVCV